MSNVDAKKLFAVEGLVAVVTGGGTGIGLMIAKALENNGATVYIVGRRLEVLENAAKQHSMHNKLIPVVADVTSKESLSALASRIESEVGYINLLVNNSGVSSRTHGTIPKAAPFVSRDGHEELSTLAATQAFLWEDGMGDWEHVLRTNVAGVFFTTVAFLGLLDAGNKKGNVDQKSQIVTVSSIGAFSRNIGAAIQYSASKAASTHMAKIMATSFIQWGIRSNVIAPGLYPSELTVPGGMNDKNWHEMPPLPPHEVPLLRAGGEEDMAGTILFLAGRGGAYLNGNVVVTDGGRLGVQASTY